MPKPAAAPEPIPDPFDETPATPTTEAEATPTENTTEAPPTPTPDPIPEPTPTPAPNPVPDTQSPIPNIQPPVPMIWFGATLVLDASNKESLMTALSDLLASTQPMYLIEVQDAQDLLIALNTPVIALMGATNPDATVPRYFANDWKPERDLTGNRTADTFQFTGTLKCFDGSAKTLVESHRKIAENLWLVTVTSG